MLIFKFKSYFGKGVYILKLWKLININSIMKLKFGSLCCLE